DIQLMTNKKQYIKGDDVDIELNFKNKKEVNYDFAADLRIFNPDNAVIFATTTTLSLTPKGSASLSYNFSLSKDAIEGIYIIQAEAKSGGERVGLSSGAFEVSQRSLSLQMLPFTLIPLSTNTIKFEVKNTGIVDYRIRYNDFIL
ncbi:MAG: hypothetical protein QMD92_07240, partial [bacterium]|nr:hypothetical protein [bacterium]